MDDVVTVVSLDKVQIGKALGWFKKYGRSTEIYETPYDPRDILAMITQGEVSKMAWSHFSSSTVIHLMPQNIVVTETKVEMRRSTDRQGWDAIFRVEYEAEGDWHKEAEQDERSGSESTLAPGG